MSAATIVRNVLLASPVGPMVTGGIHWTVAPQGTTTPHIVLLIGGETRGYMLQGAENMVTATVSLAIKATTATDAERIGRAAVNALKDASGAHDGMPYRIFAPGGGSADYIQAERMHRRLHVVEVVWG